MHEAMTQPCENVSSTGCWKHEVPLAWQFAVCIMTWPPSWGRLRSEAPNPNSLGRPLPQTTAATTSQQDPQQHHQQQHNNDNSKTFNARCTEAASSRRLCLTFKEVRERRKLWATQLSALPVSCFRWQCLS